ncbi:MAG: hypothetical protein LKF92_13900 [Kerstersia gyiorum]|uniref:hypothetical protein n=1 Tax=Kerstersia gyiorum TaxID=206506 RepID=UPI0024317038|nr:hypothetical protein [Kerstersia gyiorum]MCH4272823.1 hypothetical protein [Kerstersia gyiorum]
MSFTEAKFSGKRKQTCSEKFLSEMDKTIPCDCLASEIAKHYPEQGTRGRQPYLIDSMLRIHFMQPWLGLSNLHSFFGGITYALGGTGGSRAEVSAQLPETIQGRVLAAQCLQSHVSIASIALANSLNANLLRRWVEQYKRSRADEMSQGALRT